MHSVLEDPELRRQIIPLSVEAYLALADTGVVGEKSELIHGFIFAKMPKSPRHRIICQRLLRAIRQALSPGFSLWQEQALKCHDSVPEPDIAVVRGEEENFAHAHPTSAALVIEVSISTLERDLEKASVYSAAGVEEYWIIRPEENVADIYSRPGPAGYASVRRVESRGTLSPLIIPALVISLEELLA